eukprot:1178825-Prorocentrum_minimum.AAC.1
MEEQAQEALQLLVAALPTEARLSLLTSNQVNFAGTAVESAHEVSRQNSKAVDVDEVQRYPALFDVRVWGSLIGMCELNTLARRVTSPVEDYFVFVDRMPEQQRDEVTRPCVKPLLANSPTPFNQRSIFVITLARKQRIHSIIAQQMQR